MRASKTIIVISSAVAAIIGVAAAFKKPKSIYRDNPEEQNPFEGKNVRFVYDEDDPINADGECGHLEVISDFSVLTRPKTFYERYCKHLLDLSISFLGLIALSPFMLLLSIMIFLDDPGPVLFTQKRVGKGKQFFALHKFRSMKMSTPHDVPTHMLENPDSYITRVGRVLRRMSLDELPQLWDIFVGNMSLVGPRPALWNQDVLVAQREKYHANDVTPGLTGWAQVNGRDELTIVEKAGLDGEYCNNITLKMDITCILMTIANVLKHEGIIEGGTGAMEKQIEERRKEIESNQSRT